MMSGPSDFPLDGIELSTAVGHWTIRVRAIDIAVPEAVIL